MAKFIVIDGLDGCGKATQTEILKQELEKIGKKVVKIDFPKYESDSSAAVRMYLNGELGNEPTVINPYMAGSFYAVDRFIQYVTDWKKYFDEDDNTIILADRYLSANIIHQGGKIENTRSRHEYIDWCYDYECRMCKLPRENVTIILTVKPEISQKLMTSRYNGDESKKDIHEGNIEYLNNCYNRLEESISFIQNSGIAYWKHINCEDETGTNVDTKENIAKKILDIVNEII